MGEAVLSSPTAPSNGDRDAPLEAIVLESASPAASPVVPVPPVSTGPALAKERHFPPTATPKIYVVPKRFGVSGILGLTTGMALLFGFLRFLEAPPLVFLFLGVMVLMICIVQMFYGSVPRQASMFAGAALLPLILIATSLAAGVPLQAVFCSMFFSVGVGAALGYIVGTCVAGIFLVMEKIDPYLPGGRARASKADEALATPRIRNNKA